MRQIFNPPHPPLSGRDAVDSLQDEAAVLAYIEAARAKAGDDEVYMAGVMEIAARARAQWSTSKD